MLCKFSKSYIDYVQIYFWYIYFSCDATVTCSFDKNVMNLTVIKKKYINRHKMKIFVIIAIFYFVKCQPH